MQGPTMDNHDIKKAMKHRRQLYDYAKQYNTEESWSSYCKARNKVNTQWFNQPMNGIVQESWTLLVLDNNVSSGNIL